MGGRLLPTRTCDALLGAGVVGYLLVNFLWFGEVNGLLLPRPGGWTMVFWVKTLIEVVTSLYALVWAVDPCRHCGPTPFASAPSHDRAFCREVPGRSLAGSVFPRR